MVSTPAERETDARFAAVLLQIESLRILKEHDIRNLELRFAETKEATAQALEVARASAGRTADEIGRRFESVNEFRGQLKDQAATLISRAEHVATMAPISERLDRLSRPNVTAFISIASVLLVIIGATWSLVGLKIEAAVAPIVSFDAVSDADRKQLNDRMRIVDERITVQVQARQAQIADIIARLTRLEEARRIAEGNTKPVESK